MPNLHQIIERHWRQPYFLMSLLLRPLSLIFKTAAEHRRAKFLAGNGSEKLTVPVVIIGNIHVGGSGKTPVVAALANNLRARGFQIGIISRGYGRKNRNVHLLTPQSSPEEAGDEPLLLYHQTGAPIAVGAKRAEAGKALLAAHPELDLIIADDGLQHYGLARDMEIAVFPAADTGRTNLDLLPNGSLREPLSRLDTVDAVVISGGNGKQTLPSQAAGKQFHSRLQTGTIYRLNQPETKLDHACLKQASIAAIAGIAKPERFFDTLRQMGIVPQQTLTLPDHADWSALKLPEADIIFVTEKDAVKLSDRHWENVWVLPVYAIIKPDLAQRVIQHLKLKPRTSETSV